MNVAWKGERGQINGPVGAKALGLEEAAESARGALLHSRHCKRPTTELVWHFPPRTEAPPCEGCLKAWVGF